jgi:hypothetical protein
MEKTSVLLFAMTIKFVNVEERMIPVSISETAISKGSDSYLKDSLKP